MMRMKGDWQMYMDMYTLYTNGQMDIGSLLRALQNMQATQSDLYNHMMTYTIQENNMQMSIFSNIINSYTVMWAGRTRSPMYSVIFLSFLLFFSFPRFFFSPIRNARKTLSTSPTACKRYQCEKRIINRPTLRNRYDGGLYFIFLLLYRDNPITSTAFGNGFLMALFLSLCTELRTY